VLADCIRDELLPAGVVDDRRSYEPVEAFERLAKEEVVGGVSHVAEREQQREWCERAQR
jgi:hypothetical protein